MLKLLSLNTILICFLLGFPRPLLAEDRWVFINQLNNFTAYYDKESIACSPEGFLNIWIKTVNNNYQFVMTEYQYNLLGLKKGSEFAKELEKPYTRIDLKHYEIDCKRRIYKILSAQWFTTKDNNFYKNKDIELDRWSSLIPNSELESIFLSLCSQFLNSACQSEGTTISSPKNNNDQIRNGTGVIISKDGFIITAAHVVTGANQISIITKGGVLKGDIIKMDKVNDIALLKINGILNAAPLINAKNIKLGQTVFTIGFPNIDIQGFDPKMTKGEISSLSGFQDDPRHWQISLPIQKGNSGGPLFDEAGNIVGLILSKLDAYQILRTTGDIPQNVNYAIKSTYIFPLLEGITLPNSFQLKPNSRLETIVEKIQDSAVLIIAK